MSLRKLILTNEYDLAYDFKMRMYSEPKIYDAKGDLKKRWYVYFSFRNPATNKLERQTPIYLDINNYKTVAERREAAKNLQWAISRILKNGYNPYVTSKLEQLDLSYSIKDAFEFALKNKKNLISENSYTDFKSRITQFKTWLGKNGIDELYNIDTITKKVVKIYLNEVAEKSSARNRNNTRSNLNILFKVLEDNEIVKNNFIPTINVLKSNPERNKTYTSTQIKEIQKLLNSEPVLSLMIAFVSYNFLRPLEVCRLKIKDIDLVDKKIMVRAKNKKVKIKIIPDIVIDLLPDLSNLDPNSYFITPFGFGCEWNTTEVNKRNYFSNLFLEKIKKPLNLGKDYGLYSFRHTFITELYNNLTKKHTPFEAKSKLMLITGHTTMTALEKYLRDIDAVLPDDYSNLFKK